MAVAIAPELRSRLAAPEALIPAVLEDMGNPPWEGAAQRVLIVRLSAFEDVVGSSSHLFLFSECRRALGRAFIDFAFLPGRRDRELLSAKGIGFYCGLASGRPPEDFDLVLVSNAFALELVNIGYLFSERLSSRASERARAREVAPIVILGGSNAAACGSLLPGGQGGGASSDCLVDGIFFGEGEATTEPGGASALAELVLSLAGDPREARASRLSRASSVRGFWPALSGIEAERSVARPYPAPLVDYPVLNSGEAGAARLQISAGCPGLCSFCLEGWDRRPYREIPADRLIAAARELRERSGAETLEVYSFNFNTHESILDLIFELGRIFKRVNLMSQRLDILARKSALLAAELAADKRSFTLGIEGVSRRMRAFYRKGIAPEDVDSAASALIAPGIRELKLFYMIAGLEDASDLEEFSAFASRVRSLKKERASGTRVLASAGYLVRLPGTPLQNAPLCLDRDLLASIAERMRAICETAGIEFRLAADYDEYLADQLLSLGGERLCPWVEGAPSRGFVYDGKLSRGTARSLELFAREEGLLDAAFLAEKDESWRPPLSFALGDPAVLRSNYLLAAEGEDRRPCLGMDEEAAGACEGCGACEDAEDVERLTGHAIRAPSGGEAASRIARIVAAKRGLARALVRVDLPESLGRATGEYRASWLSRRIAAAAPREFRGVLELRDALFEDLPLADRYWGAALYELRGPEPRLLAAAAERAGLELLGSRPEPSSFEIEIRLPAAFAEAAKAALADWLRSERVDCIETRTARGRRLECGPASAKKRVLYAAEIYDPAASAAPGSALDESGFLARLSLGPKARLADWLRALPPGAERSSSVRVVSW
jgi:radical SAM superfamily enzyme YgiQ (UPF0313 family)